MNVGDPQQSGNDSCRIMLKNLTGEVFPFFLVANMFPAILTHQPPSPFSLVSEITRFDTNEPPTVSKDGFAKREYLEGNLVFQMMKDAVAHGQGSVREPHIIGKSSNLAYQKEPAVPQTVFVPRQYRSD